MLAFCSFSIFKSFPDPLQVDWCPIGTKCHQFFPKFNHIFLVPSPELLQPKPRYCVSRQHAQAFVGVVHGNTKGYLKHQDTTQRPRAKMCDDNRSKCVMDSLMDATGLVLTCKVYTDTFVNLNWKAVTSHYFFASVCLRLWHRTSRGPRHMKGMCSHIWAPHEVFFFSSSPGNHKNHISPDTWHV